MGFDCGLIWLSGEGRLSEGVCVIRPCLGSRLCFFCWVKTKDCVFKDWNGNGGR